MRSRSGRAPSWSCFGWAWAQWCRSRARSLRRRWEPTGSGLHDSVCQKRRRSRNWTPYSARRPGGVSTPVAGRVGPRSSGATSRRSSLAAPSPATDMRPRSFAVSQSTSAPRPDSRVWRQRKESRSGAHFDRCARSTGCTYQGPVAGTPGASYSSLGHLIWPLLADAGRERRKCRTRDALVVLKVS